MALAIISAQLTATFVANEAREKWIATLPKKEQKRIRREDAKKRQEYIEHQRKLEIANARRPRNFWGN